MPTLDGGPRFRECLAALGRQRPALDALVVIDSGSTDGTPEAAEQAGATVLRIAPERFDHGATRNQGAAALPAGLEAVVFLVQDAVPLGDDGLERLAAAAVQPGVGAATARQVPPDQASALTRATVDRSPQAAAEPVRTGPLSPDQRRALSPRGWLELLRLDCVACAVRGPLFSAVGFRTTPFGEDALLAFDLLSAGWALQHEPAAVVAHGHEYDRASVADRYAQDARFFREAFGVRVRGGPLSVVKGWLAQLKADSRWFAGAGADADRDELRRAVFLRWAQVVGQWRGSRGPLGGPPSPRAVPGPEELAA